MAKAHEVKDAAISNLTQAVEDEKKEQGRVEGRSLLFDAKRVSSNTFVYILIATQADLCFNPLRPTGVLMIPSAYRSCSMSVKISCFLSLRRTRTRHTAQIHHTHSNIYPLIYKIKYAENKPRSFGAKISSYDESGAFSLG